MASSSDDELMPEAVSEYHFVDEKEQPICFSRLPILLSEDENIGVHKDQIFLYGKTDDGLQKVYKQVTAWKVEFEGDSPTVSVLSKDKKWLKLLKPRKAYEDTIRKILITLECLLYVKRNPTSSDKKLLWEHIRKVFSQFEIKASEGDLLAHQTFIHTMITRDEILSKSQLSGKLLSDLPKKNASEKKIQKSDFINDNDDEGAEDNDGEESDEDVECFDTVCTICDNGGELLCCEGDCLRSFHASTDTGRDSQCKTLRYTRAQVQAIQSFLCPNCVHKKHQCFACGKLGSSDKASGAEVFRCISASCGRFYHPHCAATLLHPGTEAEASALEEMILAGDAFVCPVHTCVVCGKFEDKENNDLQFAMCRRCPTSYHRKCLPREISFEDSEDEDEDAEVRAWDGLIPHRILIYCLKHEINKDLGTPERNHIKFPGILENRTGPPTDSSRFKIPVKRKADDLYRGKMSDKLGKTNERARSTVGAHDNTLSGSQLLSVKKLKASDTPKKDLKENKKMVSTLGKKKSPTIEKVHGLDPVKSVKKDKLIAKVRDADPSWKNLECVVSSVDEETKKRIMHLVKKLPSSSLTVEDLSKRKTLPTAYAHCTRNVGKSITQGKVEGSIEAVRAALQKFEKGCRIEDAKAVCGPDILNQILSWRKRFKVYLSPFLHGVRYSSYGRHFTKVDKLEEIVERLHWYVQNGDMIVDFCCGANDFSLLMKKKLEATGKKCFFKNYDLFQPKNDFNFEKRDWNTVHPKELPTGSQLIMGLNPPFGVNAALANKFIDKALEFKPKILILIVPKETQRLDEKRAAYDLIWEDEEKLAGKSFYLPGSVDINDNQIEQWNVKTPSLYLWSRPDWTARHMAIALKNSHISNADMVLDLEAVKDPPPVHHPEDRRYCSVPTERIFNLPKKQTIPGAAHEEKAAYPTVWDGNAKLENGVDRKGKAETAKRSDEGKSQKSKVRVKNSSKMKSKKQDKAPGNRTRDDASDMSISPPHDADAQQASDVDLTVDAHIDGITAFTGFNRSAPYGEERSGSLARSDIDGLERGHARDDVDNLERHYGSGDMNNLDSRYASSTWNGSSLGGSYDLPNDPTGRLNLESRYGITERLPGYVRDNPLPAFESSAYTGEERQMRRDTNNTIAVYRQQGPNDIGRGWRAPEKGVIPTSAQTAAFPLPYGSSSLAAPTFGQTGSLPYGLSGSSISSSAMNRYAPRLDELNHAGLGSSMPRSMQRPGDSGMFEMLDSRPPFSGSQNSFPGHRPSGGWLDD